MGTVGTNNLALCFQEVLTAILRVRFQRQQVQDSESFRAQMRRSLQSAMQDARSLGYSSDTAQTAVFATVAYLDESVLSLQSPVFAEWPRRLLQEELFGATLAGEAFFRNLQGLLSAQDSPETADALELHCLCLQMGYRGRYALEGAGELHQLLRMARGKIERIRGAPCLMPSVAVPEVPPARTRDPWTRTLLIATCVLAGLVVMAFAGYQVLLGSGVSHVQNAGLTAQ
ncbi:MAG: DotU family type IV/VI secretion system protein [Terracidiphilus sp.]|nr:DotU family type IV/VI secretion system protein [Terracidiphilus sp.]